ncbi:MAG: 2-succinyl-5-enolpyruvyl-6-hydroxy-3-cyclohexene-1-carboxylic-acid synthase [Bacteroidota bacterium]
MSQYQTNINTIPATLFALGLRYAVISPGSRNAPLIMAFARFKKIQCISVPDERTAGFIALGMAKQLQQPTAVICTSGTAVLNLYPAIAEAYYMQIPLIVITADRPKEMIDRWDGQTIRQFGVFKPHIKLSVQTPDDLMQDEIQTIQTTCQTLYSTTQTGVQGPVHLNVPLAEPLYAAAQSEFIYPSDSIPAPTPKEAIHFTIPQFDFSQASKVMVLMGAEMPEADIKSLKGISNNNYAVVAGDIISNKQQYQNVVSWEGVLLNTTPEQLQELVPDLLITTGKMVLNKTVKQLFRKHPPKAHWHVTENGFSADSFFTNPRVIQADNTSFFNQLEPLLQQTPSLYFETFSKGAEQHNQLADISIHQNFNEFAAVKAVLQQLPNDLVLHLANSMSIRYAAYLSRFVKHSWELHSNRGVSGIDGCTSTAIGAAMVDPRQHVLITGDIAFFYDINALWQSTLPKNIKILLLNNNSGGIFQNIDGPAGLPELNPFLSTPHNLNAALMAQHFNLPYLSVTNEASLEKTITEWLNSTENGLLEIITDPAVNAAIFKQFKQQCI